MTILAHPRPPAPDWLCDYERMAVAAVGIAMIDTQLAAIERMKADMAANEARHDALDARLKELDQ